MLVNKTLEEIHNTLTAFISQLENQPSNESFATYVKDIASTPEVLEQYTSKWIGLLNASGHPPT